MQYVSSPTPLTQLNTIAPIMKAFKNKKVLAIHFITYYHFNGT